MYQIRVDIGQTFPISLVLISDGRSGKIAFVRNAKFSVVFENEKNGAVFGQDGFSIEDEEYSYDIAYPYKELPVMLKWLKKQKLQMPEGMF